MTKQNYRLTYVGMYQSKETDETLSDLMNKAKVLCVDLLLPGIKM